MSHTIIISGSTATFESTMINSRKSYRWCKRRFTVFDRSLTWYIARKASVRPAPSCGDVGSFYARILVSFHNLMELFKPTPLTRTSATNCARLYSLLHPERVPPEGWSFGFTLTSEHVWDGFILLSLLEDCDRRQERLTVPHGGLQNERFTAAIHARKKLKKQTLPR